MKSGFNRIISRKLVAAASIVVLAGCVNRVAAQAPTVTAADFTTGGEFEQYLRVLQISGKAPLYPWSIRGFSPLEIDSLLSRDSAGVWKFKHASTDRISVNPLNVGAIFNSAFPYGANDGPVWAGKGVTGVVSGGIFARKQRFSLVLELFAFRANNLDFPLYVNGQGVPQNFGDALDPQHIDLPQRFGPTTYGRFDAGSSTLRFDSRHISAGFSNANQWIGPATEYPFLLGTNAPGFPHLFLATGTPRNIRIGSIHARASWGKLFQSAYSPVTGSERFVTDKPSGTTRLATSIAMVFIPRGAPGLELGAARFFHVPYMAGQPDSRFWTKAFKLFYLKNEYAAGDSLGQDNQLASIFFRWAFPKTGFELYGERGYDDQFYDARDFLQDLDHDRSYMLGFQKILGSSATHVDAIKGELINQQLSNLFFVRAEAIPYTHSTLRQGHTNRGQLLGANAGLGGSASVLSWNRYSVQRRSGITLRRVQRMDRGEFIRTGTETSRDSDVVMSLGFDQTRFHRLGDFGFKVEAMRNYNRNFSSDVSNLNLQLFARLRSIGR